MTQKEYFGFGSIKDLKEILIKNNPKNIFLVTGKKSYELCGAKKMFDNLLKSYNVTRFYDFSENPKLKDLKIGVKLFKEKEYDIIIAIGGGTVIDMAKLINIFAAQTGTPLEYIKKEKKIEKRGKPSVAIPTTAGSGSEATRFAVVYDDGLKYSVEHKYVLPEYSIVDPKLTMSMPSKIAASTGIDALGQAIESYWNINSTQISKKFAKKAIKLLVNNFEKSIKSPTRKIKKKVMYAANLSGKAINITKTTACHSISYPLTSYFNIPHGHAVGLTLGEVLLYNSRVNKKDCTDKRGSKYVRDTMEELANMISNSDVIKAKEFIENLMKKTGLKTKLSQLGIKREDLPVIVKNGFAPKRMENNPRKITKQRLYSLLESIF